MNDYIWILIAGIVIVVGGALLWKREKRLFENAVPATATVVRYDEYRNSGHQHTMYTAVVTYTLADGTPMEAKEQAGRNRRKYEIGQTLDIEYSPIQPYFFVIRGDSSRTFAFVGMLVFGLAMIGLAVVLYLQGTAGINEKAIPQPN